MLLSRLAVEPKEQNKSVLRWASDQNDMRKWDGLSLAIRTTHMSDNSVV